MNDNGLSRFAMLHDIAEKEAGTVLGRDEKAALKRAKEAERAFRVLKGYPPKSVWARLCLRFKK